MQEVPIVLGFTAGELSPWLSTRFDLQAYQRGAADITNFQVLPYGGIQFRPGTELVATARSPHSRLVPFYYAENDVLMLEVFPYGIQVYKDGKPVIGRDGNAYVIPGPWKTKEQIDSLHFSQVNDIIYVCSPWLPPTGLLRCADNQWVSEQIEFPDYPREEYGQQVGELTVMLDTNGKYADLTILGGNKKFSQDMMDNEYILADAVVQGRVLFANQTMNVSAVDAPDLSTTQVKRRTTLRQHDASTGLYHFYYCIRSYAPTAFAGSQLLSDYPYYFQPGIMRVDDSGLPYEIVQDWELSTTGTWNAHWELWRSYDTLDIDSDFRRWDWECIKTFSQSDYEERKNWAISGSEPRPCRMVLVCRCCSSPDVIGAVVQFKVLGGVREYKMRITMVTDDARAQAEVINSYLGVSASFTTKRWSFGAFGARNGYPAFSALYQGRLWFGGMQGLPTTLFASAIDDFYNFRVGTNDDDAMSLSVVDSDQSRLCWLCATRQLLVGTADSEWVVTSSSGGSITPGSVMLRRQSSVGSEALPARAVENTVLFVQRGGSRMREIAYRLESDGFSATDISMLAEHLFASGVKEWCVQRGSNFNVWVLMKDGSLAVLTINLEQQVTAWQKVKMHGRSVLHVNTLQNSESNQDEVWFVTQFENTGQVVLERMRHSTSHLDCYEEIVAEVDGELQAGSHLQGIDVIVEDIQSGETMTCRAPEDGRFLLPSIVADRRYRIGIPIQATLQTMPLEGGASFNSVRQFSRFKLRLLNSDTDFEYRSTATATWEHHRAEDSYLPHPYTGAVRLVQMPDADVGQSLCIRYSGQGDFRLLAITQEVDFHAK